MALVLHYVYEQDYLFSGWPDDGGGGVATFSWYDHDVTSDPIPLGVLEPDLFIDGDDVFYVMPPLTTEVMAQLFVDEDAFFAPMSVRALVEGQQMLRNEIRRVR